MRRRIAVSEPTVVAAMLLLTASLLASVGALYATFILPKQVEVWSELEVKLTSAQICLIQLGSLCHRMGLSLAPSLLLVTGGSSYFLIRTLRGGEERSIRAGDRLHTDGTQATTCVDSVKGTRTFYVQWCLIGCAFLCILFGPVFLPTPSQAVEIGPIKMRLADLLRVAIPFLLTSVSLLMGARAFRDVTSDSDQYGEHIISNVTYAGSLVIWAWMVGCVTHLCANNLVARCVVVASYVVLYVAPKTALFLRRHGRTPLLADAFLCAVCGTLLIGFLPSVHGGDRMVRLAFTLLSEPQYWLFFLLPASLAIARGLSCLPTARGRRWIAFFAMQPAVCMGAVAFSWTIS